MISKLSGIVLYIYFSDKVWLSCEVSGARENP